MKCQKCGTECPDGNLFCEACGAELETPVLPENIDEKGRVKKIKRPRPAKAAKARPEKTASAKERRVLTPEEREKRASKVKAVFIGIGVIAVVVLVVVISHIIEQSKGLSAAQSIPLGRNVPYAVSETGLEFTEKSANGLINSICDFDYICISEDTVKVNGSEQPRWAIMLTVDGEDIITAVEYYDFKQLKLNWKGRLMPEMLTQESLEYGMSIRNVNKTLGLRPYYVRRSVSNDSVYCYRYYCSDAEEGYDRVFNYYVEFSDIELAVKGIRSSEINYANAIFNAGPTSIATPVNVSNEEEAPDEDGESGGEADDSPENADEDGENTEE